MHQQQNPRCEEENEITGSSLVTITGIARHVRRSGRKPRDSKRYVEHVTQLRGFISTELRRIINRFVEVRKPTAIFLERLNFQSPHLSRRMNRILQNCGRSVLKAKLQALKEEFGIEVTEVAPAYTMHRRSR